MTSAALPSPAIGLAVFIIASGDTTTMLTAISGAAASQGKELIGTSRPGRRRVRMEGAAKAIVRFNEFLLAALIFGAMIGLVSHLSSLDAQGGAPEAANVARYLERIPHYLSLSLFPSNGYGAI